MDLIDLDLDVVRRRHSGRVELLDEDEFAHNRASLGYPEQLVDSARRTSTWLVAALGDGTEPFASAFRPFLAQLDRAARRAGPELRDYLVDPGR